MTFGNLECSWFKIMLLFASFLIGGFMAIDDPVINVADNVIRFLQGGSISFVICCVIMAFMP